MTSPIDTLLYGATIAVGAHTLLKPLAFLIPYALRRSQLDQAYGGQATASSVRRGDWGLRGIACILVAAQAWLLFVPASGATDSSITAAAATRREMRALVRGLWLGATAIQVYFHGFTRDPPRDRAAPPPLSPIKRLSYAIQDSPWSAELVFLMAVTLVALILGV